MAVAVGRVSETQVKLWIHVSIDLRESRLLATRTVHLLPHHSLIRTGSLARSLSLSPSSPIHLSDIGNFVITQGNNNNGFALIWTVCTLLFFVPFLRGILSGRHMYPYQTIYILNSRAHTHTPDIIYSQHMLIFVELFRNSLIFCTKKNFDS